MKILYFSNSTSNQGGAELNLFKIYNYFSGLYDVSIILPNNDGIYKVYIENGYNPIIIKSIRPSKNNSKLKKIYFLLSLPIVILKIRKLINKNEIDIVHTNDIIDFPAMIATKLSNAKLISHLRFIINANSLQKKVFKWLYLFCSDQIICVSNAVRNNWFPNTSKAKVIYNGGPDLNVFNKVISETRINNDNFKIVTVGKLVKISGHENIIKAIHNIENDLRERISLTIIGGSVEGHSDYEQMLYSLVERLGLSNNVVFKGYQKDVHNYLNEADLFCFTPTWEHAFPTVVLEAMAMQLPIVAYNIGGISEQVDHNINGYLVNDVSELTSKIQHIMTSQNKLTELSLNSRTVLQSKFSLMKHFKEIETIYLELHK